MTTIWILIALIVVGMGYIRLAPSNPSHWHVSPDVTADADMPGGVKRLIQAGPAALGQLDAIIRATPRTRVLAGSVEEGRITYVTRSRVMGFPDYTTVEAEGDTLKLEARLRFGRSDLGVNRDRVDEWLVQLEQIQTGGQG
ncbi:DUF1499 domain-containing protein [Aestuariivita sp.]|jgi:uncharacterized protein (DUF1499 family)|uniref:DUF1499 domain-containing protein n=1 Tax=Aestuariivita sp. TaxID=1872407 RepID=UPI0025C289E1|nr:DUF1499 domain-containing protein [Aestuariivita sp.]